MKYLLRLVVVILMVGSAYAQSNLPACTSSGHFHNCFGTYTIPSGSKYVGEWKDNKYNGQGTFTHFRGHKYVGEWKDGKYNGQGTQTFATGDKFVGEWKDGELNGQGTTYSANGSIISQGIWADGKLVRSAPVQQATAQTRENERLRTEVAEVKRTQSNLPACPSSSGYFHNCFGTFTLDNGDKYVGEVKENHFNGQGTFTYANGNKYVGEFKDGEFNGQGTFTYANGNKYVGEFKDGEFNGQGIGTFVNGEKYVGEFKDDDRNGLGTTTFANGDKYVGGHKDGKRNGQGTYTFANGNEYVGEYKDGEYNGQGTYTYADGTKYIGEWKDDKYNGQGTMYASNGSIASQGIWAANKFVSSAPVQQATVPVCQGSDSSRWSYCFGTVTLPKGEKYSGEWKDGKRSGQGTYTYANGEKHVGEYKDGERNGQGTYTYADGTKYVGAFMYNVFYGQGTMYTSNGSIARQGIWASEKLFIPAPVQQATAPNQENERLRAEAEEAKRKQAEAEEGIRVAQQQAAQTSQIIETYNTFQVCVKFYPPCLSVERFVKRKNSKFNILNIYKITMTLEDILKKCEYRPYLIVPRGATFDCALDDKSTISKNFFDGRGGTISAETFIHVILYRHDKINALRFDKVRYFTCSPPWNRTRQTVLEKYSKDSVIIEDLTDAKNKTNQITFHSDDEKNETIIARLDANHMCPGGYGLSVTLVNGLKYDEEPLYKQILNDLQNKLPVPKL